MDFCVDHKPYSRLRHLVNAVRLNHDPRSTVIVALTAYLDASGTQDEGTYLIVSGFLSSEKLWLKFEREWKRVLDRAGINYFHMKEFTQSMGQFRAWKGQEEKRKELLRRLIDIIGRTTMQSFSAGVLLADWGQCNNQYQLREQRFTPYALCGWVCVEQVYRWCEEKSYPKNEVLFIAERGDKGQGDLVRRVEQDYGVRLRLEAKVPEKVELPITPLQASDFAAWQINKHLRQHAEGTLKQLRRDFVSLLSRVPHQSYHRHFSMKPALTKTGQPSVRPPSLVRFCQDRRITLRVA